MSTITRLYLQALVTKTAAFAGAGVAVDAVLGAGESAGAAPSKVATLVIRIASMDAVTARIQISDSVDNFSADATAAYVVHLQGGHALASDRVIRIPWYDIPDARFGVTSAKMKVSLTSISAAVAGTSAGITYEAWVEY